MAPPKGKKAEILIINGVECEPFLTADYRLMIERSEKILQGIKIFQKILGVKSIFLAIEDNKPEAIHQMIEKSKEYPSLQIASVATKYPQGSEKQLIEAITKRQVPIGGLPIDVGVIVQNVGTAAAVSEAVMEGIPLIRRVVTVTGHNILQPGNYEVRLGTLFSDLIDLAGGCRGKMKKLIMGGPMMGFAVLSDQVPVIKGTSGILAPSEKEARYYQPQPCIRCGKCLQVCPMRLAPGRFIDFTEEKELDKALEKNILNCMECGACTYICPARRPMVQWIKLAKEQIRKNKQKEMKIEK